MESMHSAFRLPRMQLKMWSENILHPNIAQYEKAEKFCLQLISEFLQSYEFGSTLAAFTKECTDLGYILPLTTKKERLKKEDVLKILEHFAYSDLKSFFDAWEMLVPSCIQETLEYKKLTFYLHIHFAVLPLRKRSDRTLDDNLVVQSCVEKSGQEDLHADESGVVGMETASQVEKTDGKCEADHSRGMYMLRNFLETKGTEFSAEPEFLPYYALPFVSNPASHPSFQELFMESWVSHLTSSLQEFVVRHCWGAAVAPQLLKLGLNTQSDTVQNAHSQLLETQKNLKHLRRRYQKLHKDHHNLIGVAAELTGALESSVKGQAVDLKVTLNNCTKIFPDLFSQSPGMEQHRESYVDHRYELYHALTLLQAPPEEVIHRMIVASCGDHAATSFELDFRKIKQHLSCGSVKTKLLLFQALRWHITKSPSEDRDSVVGSYFRHDVLSLHHSVPHTPSVLEHHCVSPRQLPLYAHFNPTHASTPHPLQQVAARLVNTLASLRSGRDYLCCAGCRVLRVLFPCLQGDREVKTDIKTADMILATLQKLSLRRSQRVAMIDLGLVEWLIQRLSADASSMKAYTLEYSTALLMNLCLHHRAKERCVPLAKTVLKLLMMLLGTKITQAIPYVNGTLYSLLAHPQLNHEAKHMGLCGVLEYYLKNSEGEMSKQLEYILKLHRGDCQPDHSSTSDEENGDDDTEEVDLLEEELDSDDPVRSLQGELSGYQLLYQQYRLVFPYHGVVHPSSSSSPARSVGDVLLRPSTPQLLSRGSLEGKGATSTELHNAENKEEAVSEMCSKTCNSLMLESVEQEDEDGEDDSVVCNGTNVGGVHTDRSTDDSRPLQRTDCNADKEDAPSASQPSATSEDGEDEYTKAFSSRPKIPRTPTLHSSTGSSGTAQQC